MFSFIAATAPQSLSAIPGWAVVVAIAAVMLLSGVVVISARYYQERWWHKRASGKNPVQPPEASSSIIRSWIAIALVGGLLVLCGVAFTLNDTTLRNTLIGGLIANAGVAVAFYFSSQSQADSRQDLLTASQGTTSVPTLTGLSVADAQTTMSKTSLQLVLDDPPGPTVLVQSPNPGASVRTGTSVVVLTKSP